MGSDLGLRRKYTFKIGGRNLVLIKKAQESYEHVLMKALGFALYVPRYPNLIVEYAIGDKYKPDLVQLDDRGQPVFWGECGDIAAEKIRRLARKYRPAHIVIFKMDANLTPFAELIRKKTTGLEREGILELVGFPQDAYRFVSERGQVSITFDHCRVIAF